MNLPKLENRREKILTSAWKMFTSYGFRRTSMQDIADAVGISRPALYLEFANKTDIFRAMATALFASNIVRIEAIFAGNRPIEKKLLETLNVSFAEFYSSLSDTPHGEELMSIKAELAGDIYMDWLKELKATIRNGIDDYLVQERIGIDATELSEIIINAMNGLKSGPVDEAGLRKGAKNVVSLVMAALSPSDHAS